MRCNKGCSATRIILYDNECIYEAEDENQEVLDTFEAYRKVGPGDLYGHINYGLAAYCVDVGHLECL